MQACRAALIDYSHSRWIESSKRLSCPIRVDYRFAQVLVQTWQKVDRHENDIARSVIAYFLERTVVGDGISLTSMYHSIVRMVVQS